jgi:uncharacterized integral membrane protein (TIGR00698 family)
VSDTHSIIPPSEMTKVKKFKSNCITLFPGTFFCVLLVLGASYIAEHYGSSKILGALLLGMAFNSIYKYPDFSPGLEFCAKSVLRFGVALLGVRITFSQVTELGVQPVIVVVVVVIATIVFSILFGYLLKVDRIKSIVSGAAVGICGVSAALAVAAVLPQSKDNEKYLLCTVVSVACISTICMILYPGLLLYLDLSAEQMGIFLGASIHDVAQVFGAGEMISTEVSELATYTKMLRVAMLVPAIMVFAFLFRSHAPEGKLISRIFPWFLVAFLVLMISANLKVMPAEATTFLGDLSKFCLWVAMAALGAKTNLLELWQVGRKPLLLLLLNTVLIAAISLILVL